MKGPMCATTERAMAKVRAVDAQAWLREQEWLTAQSQEGAAYPDKAEIVVAPGRRLVYRLQAGRYALSRLPAWAEGTARDLSTSEMKQIMQTHAKSAPV